MRTLLSCVSAAILAASSNLAAAQNDGVEGNAAPPVQEPSANTAPDDAASVDDGNQGPGILVIGKRIADDEVRDYITNLLFPERVGFTKFYARQGEPLCPAVIGLELASKEYVIDRMRTVAKAAGIDVDDDEDCDFNLVLALVDDGAETIKRWRVKHNRRAFGWIPPHARNTVMWSGGPAYAWHIVDRGGVNMQSAAGVTTLVGGGLETLGTNNPRFTNTRMRLGATEVIYTSFVLVERDALEDVTAIQLADYALMRGMMQIQPKKIADMEQETILTLFERDRAGQESFPSLTKVDLALLVSLYSARGDVGAGRQRGDMLEPFQRVLAYGEAGVDKDERNN